MKICRKNFRSGWKERRSLAPSSGSLSSLIKCLSSTLNRDWKEPGFSLLSRGWGEEGMKGVLQARPQATNSGAVENCLHCAGHSLGGPSH